MTAVAVAIALILAPPVASDEPAAAPEPTETDEEARAPEAAPDDDDGAPADTDVVAPREPAAPVPSPRVAPPDGGEPAFVREGGIPGGYWDLDAGKGREPPDGDEQIIVGSILVPIGLVTAGSAVAFVWLSTPGACAERWAAAGASPTPQQCKGLYALGWFRVAYGSLAAITGAALLGIGLHRREQHRRWKRGISFAPWLSRGGGGLSVTISPRAPARASRSRM